MKACKLVSSLKSVAKMALHSRRADRIDRPRGGRLVIMANGPSLAQTLDEHADTLRSVDTMSVNFAPSTPAFFDMRPRYHVMADPLFFEAGPIPAVSALYDSLVRVDWPLTLFVPHRYARRLPAGVTGNPNITVARFNFVGVGGWHWLENLAYGRGLGMPRPRNVLVPAIMCGIRANYDRIDLVGADHTWTRTLTVADNNRVYSIQPHYYDNGGDTIEKPFPGHIDDILESFMIAFRSYHSVRRWADRAGVTIINATPGSFIDAFPRAPLAKS